MNTKLLAIIKRIVSEQGEAILTEPQRLKGWISDYAKDEPKAERLALGRCIEYGAYTELKNVPDAGRAAVKTRLAQKLRKEEGLDTALCNDTLDLLEAALFGRVSGQQTQAPQTRPSPQAQAYQAQAARTSSPSKGFTISLQDDIQEQTGITNKITKRSFLFASLQGLIWVLIFLVFFCLEFL